MVGAVGTYTEKEQFYLLQAYLGVIRVMYQLSKDQQYEASLLARMSKEQCAMKVEEEDRCHQEEHQ